jgi:hypothetical protein
LPISAAYVEAMRAMKAYCNACGLSDEEAEPAMFHVSGKQNELRCERLRQATVDAIRKGEPVN